jgi:hypothetical protein
MNPNPRCGYQHLQTPAERPEARGAGGTREFMDLLGNAAEGVNAIADGVKAGAEVLYV